MADPRRRLILGNGEQYVARVERRSRGQSPTPPRTFDEARASIRDSLSSALMTFESAKPARKMPGEAVFCLRLHPDSTAKSYAPAALWGFAPQLRAIGSRAYRDSSTNITATERVSRKAKLSDDGQVEGRLVFVQSSPDGYKQFLDQLDQPASRIPSGVVNELRRVERFDELTPTERIQGFEARWKEGRVELVFHPSRSAPDGQMEFVFELFDDLLIDRQKSRIREYPSGPVFVSCHMNRTALDSLGRVNPLRAAHPMDFQGIVNVRDASTAACPRPPASVTRSTIKVGMFDGGVDLTQPHLAGHVEEDTAFTTSASPKDLYVDHGTAVAGALLYGSLNGVPATSRLPAPPIAVVSFRVLPPSDPADMDLYESIDLIEAAVPARPDIKVFNLSFGPTGPIRDDSISRFTYALDSLAVAHKVTFVSAVGNDGDVPGFSRIQSPSDCVHGFGVAAVAALDGTEVADYSCHGPGRECGKVKPDLAAFGGSPDSPFHVLSRNSKEKKLIWGTSFASPLVSRVTAQATEGFDRGSALMGRVLTVHGAVHPHGKPDARLGHGLICQDIDDLLTCTAGSITVVYQGEMMPKRTVRLPVPLPDASKASGIVTIRWTVANLSPIDVNHPGDYTSGCLIDVFHPHGSRYRFSPPKGMSGKARVLHLVDDAAVVQVLLAAGWKQSPLPVTDSGNLYRDEQTTRSLDCKWEPLVSREIRKQAGKLQNPIITLQAIGRNDVPDRFDYAVAVTVLPSGYDGDLYTDVRTRFPALVPIRVRTEVEVRVQI